MKRFFLAASLAVVGLGCTEYAWYPPPDNDAECVPDELTRTRVPSTRFDGDYIILMCSVCEVDGCSFMGARCDVEGAVCDFYGKLGTCSGCCDSEYGELHCALAQ